VSEKYAFIDAECAHDPGGPFLPAIARMCRLLEVSKSGFYEWRDRPQSAAAKRREDLAALIGHVFEDSDGTYGYRRIAAQLARSGIAAGAELVRRIMRELGLVPCQPRPWRPATTQQGQAGPIPDLVNSRLHLGCPRPEDGRRYYLHRDVGRMVVSRDGH